MNWAVVIDRKEHQRNVKKAYYLVFDPKKLTYAHSLCLKMMADLKVTLKNRSIDSIYELFPWICRNEEKKTLNC